MRFFILLFIIFISFKVWGKKAFDDYKNKAEIPEPLYIDLVRGLTAEKGEWEINTLIYHTQGDFNSLNWAPEIEWVMRDGSAIEFELPMVGNDISSYKTAFQQNIYSNEKQTHMQGLQLIYEADVSFKHQEYTAYYILAHRFNHYFSTIGLHGVKGVFESSQKIDLVTNQSFFYNHSREIDLGLEFNYQSGQNFEKYFQVIPQLHLALGTGFKIQFGFGARSVNSMTSPVGTLRIIWENNMNN